MVGKDSLFTDETFRYITTIRLSMLPREMKISFIRFWHAVRFALEQRFSLIRRILECFRCCIPTSNRETSHAFRRIDTLSFPWWSTVGGGTWLVHLRRYDAGLLGNRCPRIGRLAGRRETTVFRETAARDTAPSSSSRFRRIDKPRIGACTIQLSNQQRATFLPNSVSSQSTGNPHASCLGKLGSVLVANDLDRVVA